MGNLGTGGIIGPNQNVNVVPKKFYTLQRVNGNGGNGKGDGVAGPHKHSLEESDRVKKNSVLRWMMKNEKDKKKVQVCNTAFYSFLYSSDFLLLLLSLKYFSVLSVLSLCLVPAPPPADLKQPVWIASLSHHVMSADAVSA
jgi:hypothetical protein